MSKRYFTKKQFLNACQKNDVETVRTFLAQTRFDPTFNKNAAVYMSMMYNSVGVLELLLKDPRIKVDIGELEKIADSTDVLMVLKKFKPRETPGETLLKTPTHPKPKHNSPCPICLDEEEDMFVLNCSHAIHLECASGMIKKECPICREEMKNLPQELNRKLETNAKEYKDEVIREEQEEIRNSIRGTFQHPGVGALAFLLRNIMREDGEMSNSNSSEQNDEENEDDEDIDEMPVLEDTSLEGLFETSLRFEREFLSSLLQNPHFSMAPNFVPVPTNNIFMHDIRPLPFPSLNFGAPISQNVLSHNVRSRLDFMTDEELAAYLLENPL